MIDLSALGLPVAHAPHHGGKRDKAGNAHDHGKDGKHFGDVVDELGKKGGGKQGADDDATFDLDAADSLEPDALLAAEEAEAVDPADPEHGKKIELDLSGAEASEPDSAASEGRIRLSAGFQQLMKANSEGGVLRQAGSKTDAEAGDVKTDKLDAKKEKTGPKEDLPAAPARKAATPAEELSALLGVAPKAEDGDESVAEPTDKSPAKVSKRDEREDRISDPKVAKAEQATDAIAQAIQPDAGSQQAAAQQAAAQHAAPKTKVDIDTTVAADDKNAKADSEIDALRAVSADGKARPVDIELSKTTGDDGSSTNASGKTDFITVLESRRYLGFSSDAGNGGNTAALANAIKADPSWAQVIHSVNTGSHQTATEVNTLKLQMNPEHLGNMTASLRLKGDELSVEVRVETVDAYRQLSHDHDSIVKALKDQGFAIDQVSIQLSAPARADSGQMSGNQNQSGNGGQNLQDSGQGDNARQRDESARRNANQNNWTGNDRASSFSDSGSGSDDNDTGNLYL